MRKKINYDTCFYYFETEGRQVSAKAHEAVDHLASIPLGREDKIAILSISICYVENATKFRVKCHYIVGV